MQEKMIESELTFTEDQLKKCLRSIIVGEEKNGRRLDIKGHRIRVFNADKTMAVHSNMVRLSVDYAVNGSSTRTASFLIKIPIASEILSRKFKRTGLPFDLRYNKEKYIYKFVTSKMNALFDKPIVPSYIDIFEDSRLVLADLHDDDFRDTNEQFTTMDEVFVTLRTLAKFHAAANKLLAEEPRLFPDNMLADAFYEDADICFLIDTMRPVFEHILLIEKCSSEICRRFGEIIDSIKKNLVSAVRCENFPINVLNHGMLKKDNILIKYDDKGKASDCVLVDWQTYRWCSPAADVIWFLTSSVSFQLLRSNFDQMVDFYLSTLNGYCEMFDCPIGYTRRQFDRDEKKMFELKVLSLLWFVNWYSYTTLFKNNEHKFLKFDDKKEIARRICEDAKLKKIFFDWFDRFQDEKASFKKNT